jgi:Ca2+-binding RTX toxin-like protein
LNLCEGLAYFTTPSAIQGVAGNPDAKNGINWLRDHKFRLIFAAASGHFEANSETGQLNREHIVLEGLERRRLLAAAWSVVSGKLTVSGTAGQDVVSLATAGSGLTLTIDGTPYSITAPVTSILMMGGKGNDDLAIADDVVIKATLQGNEGNDKLRGGGAGDTLQGGSGNDTLDGGKGGDLFQGQAGTDTADYSSRTGKVTVGIGSLYDDGEKGEKDNIQSDIEILIGGSGDDSLKAAGGNNTLSGNGGNDTLLAQLGNDSVDGGEGDDFIDGNGDKDTLLGSAGKDKIIGGTGTDLINGGADNDTIYGGNAPGGVEKLPDNDLIIGGEGDDSLMGGWDNDIIIGGIGADVIEGNLGDDSISGEEGADNISGGDGNDTIAGGLDDDTLDGGLGVDSMTGSNGNDLLTDTGVTPTEDPGNDDDDPLGGGDTVASTGADLVTNLVVDPEAIPAFMSGGSGRDTLIANAGPAVLWGDDGNDSLVSGDGNDVLDGGQGNDILEGNAGRDTLTGGGGEDVLTGGDDNDLFVNNDGEADAIDGGDGLDMGQVEEGLVDAFDNVESRYDQFEDFIIIDPSDPFPPDAPIARSTSAMAAIVAAQPPPVIVGGQLKINGATTSTGAAVNDVVQVTQNASTIDVTQNGVFSSFAVGSITSVYVDVGGGNDIVILELGNGGSSLTRPASIAGGSGNDTLRGGSGADLISGAAGNDSISGGGGNDILSGGSGNDILIGGSPNLLTVDGKDTFQGGDGAGDYADYGFRTNAVTLRLDGVANDGSGGENDSIGNDVEYLLGGRGNDLIVGNASANFLAGGAGADTLKGGGGNDQLVASYTKDSKIDQVFGNTGYDYLFLEDKVRDDYNGSLATDFFRLEASATTGLPLDVLVADQA